MDDGGLLNTWEFRGGSFTNKSSWIEIGFKENEDIRGFIHRNFFKVAIIHNFQRVYNTGLISRDGNGTDLIIIDPSSQYIVDNRKSFSNSIFVTFYDANENYLSYRRLDGFLFTTPKNAVYCSFKFSSIEEDYISIRKDESQNFMSSIPMMIGKYWNYANGSLESNNASIGTDKFRVTAGIQYKINRDLNNYKIYTSFYDENSNRLSHIELSAKQFTAPENAVYAAITLTLKNNEIEQNIKSLHLERYSNTFDNVYYMGDYEAPFSNFIIKVPTEYRKAGLSIRFKKDGEIIELYYKNTTNFSDPEFRSTKNWGVNYTSMSVADNGNIPIIPFAYYNYGNGMLTFDKIYDNYHSSGTYQFYVEENTLYVVTKQDTFTGYKVYVCYYSKDKKRISSLEITGNLRFTTPIGTMYASITFSKAISSEDEATFNSKAITVKTADEAADVEYRNPLYKKNIWSIGDSHKNKYETYLANKTGAIYDAVKNLEIRDNSAKYNYLSFRTINQAKYLVDDILKKGTPVDYIFIDETHYDFVSEEESKGKVNEVDPIIVQENYSYREQIFKDSTSIVQFFNNNTAEITGKYTAKPNARIACYIGSIKQSPEFSLSGTTSAGHVEIIFNSSTGTQYRSGIDIEANLTLNEALTEINQIQFGDTGCKWENLNHHESITDGKLQFTYTGGIDDADAELKVEFNLGETGLALVPDSGNIESSELEVGMYFISRNISNWANKDYWQMYPSSYSFIRGAIEYLTENIPEAKIVIFSMPGIAWNFDTGILTDRDGTEVNVKYADGNINCNAIKNTKMYAFAVGANTGLKNVAEFYSVQFIDVEKLCGFNPNNWSTYYNSNDGHCKPIGYERIADVLANSVI